MVTDGSLASQESIIKTSTLLHTFIGRLVFVNFPISLSGKAGRSVRSFVAFSRNSTKSYSLVPQKLPLAAGLGYQENFFQCSSGRECGTINQDQAQKTGKIGLEHLGSYQASIGH